MPVDSYFVIIIHLFYAIFHSITIKIWYNIRQNGFGKQIRQEGKTDR